MPNYRFQFTHSPLKNQLHKMRINQNPVLGQALSRNLTGWFFEDLVWRFKNKRNVNIYIKGEQGSGKSTGSQVIKCFNDEVFGIEPSVNDILFTKRQFMERFPSVSNGWTGIIDEDFDFATQTGAYRVKEAVRFVEQTIRGSQINMVSCAVSDSFHLYNYMFEAFDIDYKMKLNRLILLENQGFSYQPVGFILLNANSIPKKLADDYQIKKTAFLESVKAQTHRNPYEAMESKARELLKDLDTKKKLNMSFLEVHCRRYNPHLANTEIKELASVCYYISEMDRTQSPAAKTILAKKADELTRQAAAKIINPETNKSNGSPK